MEMKSKLSHYDDYQAIDLPADALRIPIPSWQAVYQPVTEGLLSHYNADHQSDYSELTDEMVVTYQVPGVTTVRGIEELAMDNFERREKELAFYLGILPWLMGYYLETSQVSLDPEEYEAFVTDYFQRLEGHAQERGLDLTQYAQSELGIQGDVMQAIQLRAREEFVFKLIAQAEYAQEGGGLDEAAYDEFINDQVIQRGADQIEVQQQVSFQDFQRMAAEIRFTQVLYDYYTPQIQVVIDPTLDRQG